MDVVGARSWPAIAERYRDGHVYTMDGVSVEYPDWHFNVRPSNTEPLIRLNLEGATPELMEAEARRGARADSQLSRSTGQASQIDSWTC